MKKGQRYSWKTLGRVGPNGVGADHWVFVARRGRLVLEIAATPSAAKWLVKFLNKQLAHLRSNQRRTDYFGAVIVSAF